MTTRCEVCGRSIRLKPNRCDWTHGSLRKDRDHKPRPPEDER